MSSSSPPAENWLVTFVKQFRSQLPQGQKFITRAQGTTEYSTRASLFTTFDGTFTSSSLFKIATNGIALDKLIIGKPTPMTPSTPATCVEQAKNQG
ncbi:hypothetical protein OBBRIDRAFT_832557 [Obba rivulosa]|uniref:Uncharacterized protein n=1 Tax=Obba rivulosa TaxID=1052685 RepID=A0A8E2J2P0_9APHY|nr:hypothetical protein OBBRIDRAFT_832557 [Obba rivulosa]